MRLAPLALALIGALLPGLAAAHCGATSLLDRLPDERRAALEAEAAATPYGAGLVWEAVRGEDRAVILGTLHVPDPRHEALLARVADEIASAERVLVEISREDEALMIEEIAADPSIMYLSDGPALPDLLPADLWEDVQVVLRARQIPVFMGAKFRPWALMTALAIPTCAMEGVMSGGLGLDHRVMAAAAEAGVPVASIESRRTLVDLFDEAGIEAEIALLRTALVDPVIQEEMYVATVEEYFAGNTALVLRVGEAALDFVPDLGGPEAEAANALFEELMLDRRNIAWSARLDAETDGADALFVAVGAAHLPGEAGLLALMEADGWTVRPLD
ncbi:TraB/GumN family protein [Wenxinia saemankumensis]|uniref:TraB family protein n=1 Tax=Wenxinia saemankumensis TaxID=1447782 RepID=A0A1M6BV98_9RHOB|nr:TraB/GumN family protein [Wenxinia saemankumensis]SHI52722.1 hypothetical protein SAMN05444417_0870 [Wenxinia saemankumensis]